MRKEKTSITVLIFLLLSAFIIIAPSTMAADSLENPLSVSLPNGKIASAAPYLFVKNTATYSYKALVKDLANGKSYAFEDSNDGDYNDVILELSTENTGAQTPAFIVFLKEINASFDHEIWIRLSLPEGYKAVHSGQSYFNTTNEIKVFSSTQGVVGSSGRIEILPIDEFDITADPSKLSVQQSQRINSTIDVRFKEGFSGSIQLSLEGLPRGANAVFDKNPVDDNAGDTVSSTLTITAGANTPVGKHILTLIGQSAHQTKKISILLQVVHQPDFRISTNTQRMRIEPGNYSTATVRVDSIGGFSENVLLKVNNLPQGFAYEFSPKTVKGQGTSSLRIEASSEVEPGIYDVSVIGTSGALVRTTNMKIEIVKYNPEITILKSADKQRVTPGEEVSFTIEVVNSGDVILKNVRVTDELNRFLDYVSASPSPEINGSTLVFNLQDLKPGESSGIKIKTRVKNEIESGSEISNIAVFTADRITSTKSNRVNLILGSAAIGLTKRVRNINPNFRPGGIVIYELVINNTGAVPIYNLQIADILPRGFTYIAGKTLMNGEKGPDPQDSGKEILWKFDKLEAESRVNLIYQVLITSAVKSGRHLNNAAITAIDGAGRRLVAGPAQVIVTVSRGNVLLWSTIEGTVFEDIDADGNFGSADSMLSGIEVLLETGEQTSTNKEGYFIFDSILPGEHVISIDPRKLPEYMEMEKDFFLVNVMEGAREKVDIPLRSKNEGSITGKVVRETLKDETHSEIIKLENIKIVLDDEFFVQTDAKGYFEFKGVPSGKHSIEIESESLPAGLKAQSGNKADIWVERKKTTNQDFVLTGNPYGKIEGRIVSLHKGSELIGEKTPVPGIRILLGSQKTAYSDENGQFRFEDVLPGKHKITVDKEQLERRHYRLITPEIFEIEIEAGKTKIVHISARSIAFLEIKINK